MRKRKVGRPKDKVTIKEYKQKIAEKQSEWSERIERLDSNFMSEPLRKEIEKLKTLKPTSKSRKADYKRYYRELDYALQWDLDTPEGQRQLDLKEQKAFQSFKENFGDIAYDDWREMVENFGSAGRAVMEQFYKGGQGGNGDIQRVYRDAMEQGKSTNVAKAMREVLKESRRDDFGYQKTPTGMLDALRDKIGLQS